MTATEVQFVLDAIEANLSEPLADVPLERTDRDNAVNLEQGVHEHSNELEEMNYVGAALVERDATPIGTEFDHELETVVNIRIAGAHVEEHGAIDPNAGTADEADYASWPVTQWDDLVERIRRAILQERTYPSVGRANVTYKDLFLTNESDQSSDYADYFEYTLDVALRGFEDLP